MKVLLLGDASNYHASLAHGLATLGHDVTLASNGSKWMHTHRDINLYRHGNPLSGAILYARLSTTLAPLMKGYDVVQMVSPGFVDLRPTWLRTLLKRLRRDNGALYLTALGTDTALVRNLSGCAPALAYSEWQYGDGLTPWAQSREAQRKKWLRPHLQEYTDLFYHTIDGVVSALYEYHLVTAAEYPDIPLAYGGIPIVTSVLPKPEVRPGNSKVKILYAVHSRRAAEKGADKLLCMLRRLQEDMPERIDIIMPPNMPYDRFIGTLAQADMVCDQLYSFTPATTALLGMAMGVVPISGGEDDFYDFIGEHKMRPVFNPDPRDLEGTYLRLRDIVADTDALRKMSAQAPTFVARHNDAITVAHRFANFWQR